MTGTLQGKAIVISAPSGAGKTTLVKHLLVSIPSLAFSVSACSRPKRENEIHGKDYYFISSDEFRHRIAHNEFMEWEEVYPGSFYGTLKSEIQRIWNNREIPIFDVDVQGGIHLKKYFGQDALAIFLQPPSLETLETRLQNRCTESPESLQKRLSKAASELTFAGHFDRIIVNHHLETACQEAVMAINQFLAQ